MRDVSNNFKRLLQTRRDFEYSVRCVMANGKSFVLSESDLCTENCSIALDSSNSSLAIGQALCQTLNLQFYNENDTYSNYDFLGAEFTVFLDFADEKITLGIFTVIEPETYGGVISLTAYDAMYKADKEYVSKTGYYAAQTLLGLLRSVCECAGITLGTTDFPNSMYYLNSVPTGVSCRSLISNIAMFAGGNAIIKDNKLYIVSYVVEVGLNGGVFDGDTPHFTGDDVDGGDFKDPSSGAIYDSGGLEDLDKIVVFGENMNLTTGTDDVIITGVTDGETLFGNEGYVLTLENELFGKDAQGCLRRIGNQIIDLRFRTFTVDHTSNPLIEFGDPCYVVDRDNNAYSSFITDYSIAFNGYTTVKCSADSPVRNRTKTYFKSKESRAIQKAKEDIKTETLTAAERLAKLVANSLGTYSTQEVDDLGGTVYYFHNAPTKEASTTIWKCAADGFTVSTDGGKTWNAGFDSQGNIVANILSAVGINAEWVHAGVLEGMRLQTGSISGSDITLGGKGMTNKAYIDILSQNGDLLAKLTGNSLTYYEDCVSSFHGTTTFSNGSVVGTRTTITDGQISLSESGGSQFFTIGPVVEQPSASYSEHLYGALQINRRHAAIGYGVNGVIHKMIDFVRPDYTGLQKPLINVFDDVYAFRKTDFEASSDVTVSEDSGYTIFGSVCQIYFNVTFDSDYQTSRDIIKGLPRCAGTICVQSQIQPKSYSERHAYTDYFYAYNGSDGASISADGRKFTNGVISGNQTIIIYGQYPIDLSDLTERYPNGNPE